MLTEGTGLEWTGGMTPTSRSLEAQHEKCVRELVRKAVMENEANRADKAAKAARKAAEKAAKAAAKMRVKTTRKAAKAAAKDAAKSTASSTSAATSPSSTPSKMSFFSRRSFRRARRLDVTYHGQPYISRSLSRRASALFIGSESPPAPNRGFCLRESLLHSYGTRSGRRSVRGPRHCDGSVPLKKVMSRRWDAWQVEAARSASVERWSSSPERDLKALSDSMVPKQQPSQTPCVTTTNVVPSLPQVLANKSEEPFDLHSFLRFARRHWMDENIFFYLEVETFKSAGGSELEYLTLVKRIHDLYIAPTAPREVNISGHIHTKTSVAVACLLRGRIPEVQPLHIYREANGTRRCQSSSRGAQGPAPNTTPDADDSSASSSRRFRPQSERGPAKVPFVAKLSVGNLIPLKREAIQPVLESPPPPLAPLLWRMHSPRDSTCTETQAIAVVGEAAAAAAEQDVGEEREAPPKTPPRCALEPIGKGQDEPANEVAEQSCSNDQAEREYEDHDRERSCSHVEEDPTPESLSLDEAEGGHPTTGGTEWFAFTVGILLEAGPGGGFGDRTIFDAAQTEIFELLEKDAYARFVQHCLRRTGSSSWSPCESFNRTSVNEHEDDRPQSPSLGAPSTTTRRVSLS